MRENVKANFHINNHHREKNNFKSTLSNQTPLDFLINFIATYPSLILAGKRKILDHCCFPLPLHTRWSLKKCNIKSKNNFLFQPGHAVFRQENYNEMFISSIIKQTRMPIRFTNSSFYMCQFNFKVNFRWCVQCFSWADLFLGLNSRSKLLSAKFLFSMPGVWIFSIWRLKKKSIRFNTLSKWYVCTRVSSWAWQ